MDAEPAIVDRTELDALFGALRERGYTVVGPTVRSQSLVYDELGSADDLPAGWVDVQEGGTFRLQRGDDEALFAHTVGHDSLKRFLFPPQLAIWRARRGADGGLEVQEPARRSPLRVHRACARATCTPWPSRTASSWAIATWTPTTRRAAATRSSWQSTAGAPAGPASARRWTPGRA